MKISIQEKLKILAESAKYDVSCASSGSNRVNNRRGFGNAVYGGICHSFTEDGRCISLLKVMLTNHCINDCAYCISRKSNDIPRTTFTVEELVDLTSGLYRRNYIEGLFLSSGVLKNANYTMERMVKVVKELRLNNHFYGYIHLKAIPGADRDLIYQAGLYADRLSVNMEIASEPNLKMLAPQKDFDSILSPMQIIKTEIEHSKEERKKFHKAPRFSPSGQSTQLIVGATQDTDHQILNVATNLYQSKSLKRVYYSGYLPLNTTDERLPALNKPPLKRENRLYQADWLFRFYFFSIDELFTATHANLDLDIDPKLGYALRHPDLFPIDVNTASYEMLLRVPGIGLITAQRIVQARNFGRLSLYNLKKMGVVIKRAKYFISNRELPGCSVQDLKPENVKKQILRSERIPEMESNSIRQVQLDLFTG